MRPTQPLEGIIVSAEPEGQLVAVTGRPALDIFTDPAVVPALLEAIRQEATRDLVPDLTTDRGRKEIASRAFKVAKSKTYLDDLGKDEVARLKDLPRKVDAGRKALRDGLDALRDEIRRPLTEWEERRERLQAQLNDMRNLPGRLFMAGSDAIRSALEEPLPFRQDWGEFAAEAESAAVLVRSELQELLEKAEKREADAAELERLRKAQAERDRLDREEQLRKEGEERARAAAPAQPAIQPASAPTAADRQAPPAVAAPLPLAQADALRRGADPAADLEHRRAFNREALEDVADILGGDRVKAEAVLRAIVTGQIRHVSITY